MSEETTEDQPTTSATAPDLFTPEDAMQSGMREIPVLPALSFHFDVPVSDVWARVHRGEVARGDVHEALLAFGNACVVAAQLVADVGVNALEAHPKFRLLVAAAVADAGAHNVEVGDGGAGADNTDSQ